MTTQEALEVFDCMANLNTDTLEVYMHSHPERIREASRVGAESIRQQMRMEELLKCWTIK